MEENRTENAPEAEQKHSRGLWSYLIWAFVVVMAYFLSIGPIALMQKKGMLISPPTQRALDVFYAPWVYICNKTPLRRPLGMYMHLWVRDLWDKNGDFITH